MLVASNYHYIRENFNNKYPSIFGVTPGQFQKQLEELSKQGTFISQEKLLSFRDRKFDDNYLLITFDDGLSEQYELARPILNKLGIPYVFFINTMNYTKREVSLVHKIHMVRSQISSKEIIDFIATNFEVGITREEKKLGEINYSYDDKDSAHLKYVLNFKLDYNQQKEVINPLFNALFDEKNVVDNLYFSKNQLQNLYKEGVLGSHSHHHVPLGLLTKEKIKNEFSNSQSFFKKEFGEEAYSISYPYGSKEACKNVEEIGGALNLKLGFSMERAISTEIETNPLMISRYDCNDLPGGKSNLFGNKNIFAEGNKSKWYK